MRANYAYSKEFLARAKKHLAKLRRFPDYIPRDISWLAFNYRILLRAQDERVPILERLNFLAIYSSNLEEFYRVRVSTLTSFKGIGKVNRKAIMRDIKPSRQLKLIKEIVLEQQNIYGQIMRNQILPDVESHGIRLLAKEDLRREFSKMATQYFTDKSIKISQLNAEIDYRQIPELFLLGRNPAHELFIIEIPRKDGRFIPLPEADVYCWIDDLLYLYLENEYSELFSFKLTRDAQIYFDEEDDSIRDQVKNLLAQRKVSLPIRILYDAQCPTDLLDDFSHSIQLSDYELIPGAEHHGWNDFRELYQKFTRPKLKYPRREKLSIVFDLKEFLAATNEILISFPENDFSALMDILDAALNSGELVEILLSIYRTESQSKILNWILKAANSGVQAKIYVELKARFDEENNLKWSEKLVHENIEIISPLTEGKVHAKIISLKFKKGDWLNIFSTGNFHSQTANVYCDFLLVNSSKTQALELEQLFQYMLEGKFGTPSEELLIAPLNLRNKLLYLIQNEIEQQALGNMAYIVIKVNNLEDSEIITALLRASKNGVKIDLIVRGICSLNPAHKDAINIQVHAHIGRYLEHARVFYFCHSNEDRMYISSADWMYRNFSNRIEVAVPVSDPIVKTHLCSILSLQLSDQKNRFIIRSLWECNEDDKSDANISSQDEIYNYFRLSKSKAFNRSLVY